MLASYSSAEVVNAHEALSIRLRGELHAACCAAQQDLNENNNDDVKDGDKLQQQLYNNDENIRAAMMRICALYIICESLFCLLFSIELVIFNIRNRSTIVALFVFCTIG
jgi:hypothetical protein